VADGFRRIAVENMANAIKKISTQRGYDVTEYTLDCFGGAGGQHACDIADTLGMTRIFLHPLAGVLSAYGMGLADLRALRERAVEKRRLRLANGDEIDGARLIALLEKMISFSKLLERVKQRGAPATLVDRFLKSRLLSAESFSDQEALKALIDPLRVPGVEIFLEKDEEHGSFEIVYLDSTNGIPHQARIGEEFVTSPEYKALYASYEGFRDFDQPPHVVVDGGETTLTSRRALVEHFLAEGKRGLSIQRYKGLGEMNADELWETTMNPDRRTLLQVRLEDEEVAENIFTTLMGDAVEPRRLFIEENALNVRNLDI